MSRKRFDLEYETTTVRYCPKCWHTNTECYEMDTDDTFVCYKCKSGFQYDYDREDIGDWDRCRKLLPNKNYLPID